MWLGYSTQGIVVVNVPIIGVEIGIVVEAAKPTSPRNS
jgi:hypothetical protein